VVPQAQLDRVDPGGGASSSMAISWAKTPVAAPGARIAVGVLTLISTSRWRVRTLAQE